MAELLHCDRCGGDNPADARFCIDCGAAVGAAATGATMRLPGVTCPSCNANNPENAAFCVVCGCSLGAAKPPQPAQPPPPAPRYNYPRVATPPTLMPSRSAPPARPSLSQGLNPGALIFVLGLFILLASRALWPGILLLIGFSSLAHHGARGQLERGLRALLWMGGLTLLFATGAFWPGIIVLIFIITAVDSQGRSRWWHW